MKYLKYIIGIILAAAILLVVVLIYNDKITQNSPLYYKQGIEFYNEGDYQNAYYNFGQIKLISPLYSMAIYRQAKSAQKLGDYNTAVIKYELFLKKSPNSIFAKNAKNNLAKSYFYLKNYEEAKRQFQEISYKSHDIMPEKDYYLALIEQKYDKRKAVDYFLAYLKKALKEEGVSKDFIIAAADEVSSSGLYLENDDVKYIALAYFQGKKYDKALKYFTKLPIESCWDYVVLSNHYAGNKLIAKKLIEEGLLEHSSQIETNNLHDIYNIYTSYMTLSKQKNWQKMYNIVKENSLAGEDYVMYKLAKLLPEEKSLEIYNDLYKKFPKSDYAPNAMWEVFWNSYMKKDYKKAEEIAINHLKTFQNVLSTPKMMFWFGKLLQKENKFPEAHNVFSKLAGKYPDNYYGLRAENILNKKNDFFKTNAHNKIPEYIEDIEFPISLSEIDINDLKLINSLFAMGDYEIWLDADFKNPIVESWFEYKKGKKSHSILLARNFINEMEIKPPFMSAAYTLAYPRYYVNEINIAGRKLSIDPFLIIALIREESYFNENAKSPVNATGLMQIMPSTANYILSKLSVNTYNSINLEDERFNLYVGCNYLKYLKERFNNDLYVVAAYNGGEGAVNKWIKANKTSDDDEFIENIPFPETQNYVKKVFRAYHMYKKIYK